MPLPLLAGFFLLWTIFVGGLTTTFVAQDSRVHSISLEEASSQEKNSYTDTSPLFLKETLIRKEKLTQVLRTTTQKTETTSSDITPQETVPATPLQKPSQTITRQTTSSKKTGSISLFKKIFAIDTASELIPKETTTPVIPQKQEVPVVPSNLYSSTELETHATASTCWIVVNGKVYSVASYISMHPGGQSIIIAQCGKDATVTFTNRGGTGAHSTSAWSLLNTFLIGTYAVKANGSCGASNAISLPSTPTIDLCTQGTASSISGSGPWTWNCLGVSGGSSVSCGAQKGLATPVTGTCGGSDSATLTSAPVTDLCTQGTATSISGTGPWTWNCTGLNGGLTSSCNAKASPSNGLCGSSSGSSFSSTPTSGLCAAGSATYVSGTGPWSWSCAGSSGGAASSCSATIMSSGGTYTSADVALHMTSSDCWIVVNGKVYSVASYISMHPGGQSIIIAQCGKDATVTFTNRGGTGAHSTSAWSLLNTFLIGTLSSIVTPTTPTVSNGVCGTSNGTTLSSVPTSGFCSTGTATSVSGTGPWSWSCAGSSGGSTASCSASKTQAVSFTYTLADVATHTTSASCWFIVNSNVYSVASYLSLHPGGKTVILNQCGKDATTAFSTRGNTGGHSASAWSLLNQYLIGTYTTAITPITPTTPVAINGICGTSNGTTVSTVPTTNFCSVGASSSIAGIGPWSWSCAGSSGGSTASCSASLASGQTTPTTPTTYTVHVTSQGNYDITALTLRAGDSITFVYSTPMSGEVDTRFSPTGISSVKIDKDITQKTRVFPSTGTWTFKAVDKSGNTGTITVK